MLTAETLQPPSTLPSLQTSRNIVLGCYSHDFVSLFNVEDIYSSTVGVPLVFKDEGGK